MRFWSTFQRLSILFVCVFIFFKKAQYFDKKKIRQSFIQEILYEMNKSNYQTKLVTHNLKKKKIFCLREF